MKKRGHDLRLVCTDFDGTLIDSDSDTPVKSEFFDLLESWRHRSNGNVTWMISTTREWESLQDRLEALKFPIWPDWVILVERQIWLIRNRRPVGWYEWNRRCELVHSQLFEAAQPLWTRLEDYVEKNTQAQIMEEQGFPMGIVASNDEEADAIARHLEPIVASFPHLAVTKNELYFRFGHDMYNKGACLQAVAQGLGVHPGETLVAGDHYNDLSMLHRRFSSSLVCPANSVEAVQRHVQTQGGYVAGQPYIEGVVEGWKALFPPS